MSSYLTGCLLYHCTFPKQSNKTTASDMLRREGERGREGWRKKGIGGVVNTGVCASDKVVWAKEKELTRKRNYDRKVFQDFRSLFLAIKMFLRTILRKVFNKCRERQSEGINASPIPTITQAFVRYIDGQTSPSSLQRDTEMAFNKTA